MPATGHLLPLTRFDHGSHYSITSNRKVVRVCARTWLVDGVEEDPGVGPTIALACLDDDAQGVQLSVD